MRRNMRRVAKEMSKKLKEVGMGSSSKGNSPGKKSGASRSTNVRVKNQGHVMLRPGTMHSLIEELSASDMGVFHRCFKMLRSRLRINYHENEKREFEEREERRLAAQRKRNSRRRRKQRKLAEQKKRMEGKMDVVVNFERTAGCEECRSCGRK